MNAADAMNHIARAVEEAMGESVDSPDRWLPLTVRYAAAEAAARVVIEWRASHNALVPAPASAAHRDGNRADSEGSTDG